ncbi:MAG: DUF5010 C-terminal domain-containing protein [Puniceicoccales bacterium]|jgi:hypothetical protein|nr:DUF5010 C-terminal domain-containing protein [Puniceicoccales bacterium]
MNKIIYGFIVLAVFVSCGHKSEPEPNVNGSRQVRSTKRGISFNILYEADFAQLEKGISWAYNWGASGYNTEFENVAKESKVAYFPMFWDSLDVVKGWTDKIRAYKQVNPDCIYLLAYNEPNLTNQANMTPVQAAEQWPQIKNLAQDLKMKIIAPAMNYGTLPDYNDPIRWLDEFFEQAGVSINDVDALAVHSYMNSPAAVKSYIEKFRKYNKRIWMTEFSAGEETVSVEDQREFMCSMLNYLESDPLIERYAWFKYDGGMAVVEKSNSKLRPSGNRKGELTDLGKIYINFSSFDKNLYYVPEQIIPAEHYNNCNASEIAGTDNSVRGPQVKVSSDASGTSDASGILEVSDLYISQWMEYQITPETAGNHQLIFRYASEYGSRMKISSNGNEISEIELPKTGNNTTWTTKTITISLGAEKQTIRIQPSEGMFSLNWWQYKKT